jgi:hypothetical protein
LLAKLFESSLAPTKIGVFKAPIKSQFMTVQGIPSCCSKRVILVATPEKWMNPEIARLSAMSDKVHRQQRQIIGSFGVTDKGDDAGMECCNGLFRVKGG